MVFVEISSGMGSLPGLVWPSLILALLLKQRRHSNKFIAIEFLFLAGFGLTMPVLLQMPAAILYSLILILEGKFYSRTGWTLDSNVIRFARREPENVKTMVRHELRSVVLPLTLLPLSTSVFALKDDALVVPAAWTLMAVCGYVAFCLLMHQRFSARLPVQNFLYACWQCWRLPPKFDPLSRSEREVLLAGLDIDVSTAIVKPNVILFVCESLSKRILESEAGKRATPRYQQFLKSRSATGRFVNFPHALSTSSCSDIAYPCMFSGLSPDQSWDRFHKTPLLWDAAKAAGYSTSLYSSQSLRWGGFEDFFINASLDRSVYRETLGEPVVNDLAMDDAILNRHVITELQEARSPFFSVINYNMLHWPFGAKAVSGRDSLESYLRALQKFDDCFADVMDALDASGQLANTVIVLTADHGETPEHYDDGLSRRMPLRLDQLAHDNLAVPFWFSVPDQWRDTSALSQLQENAALTVSHIDIYPTLLQLFGVNQQTLRRLSNGESLFSTVTANRALIMQNTSAFRYWACEPFALALGHWLLIYADLSKRFELLNLREPESGDHWSALPSAERRKWLNLLSGYPSLAEILSKRNIISKPFSVSEVRNEYDHLARQKTAELHKLSNWVNFSFQDWMNFCRATAAFFEVRNGDSVFEAGCGSGAFLKALQSEWQVEVAGMDLSADLIEVARRSLDGNFWVGDVEDLSREESDRYDKVISNCVLLYLSSLRSCEKAALEMVRLAKPGGVIFIGVLNDPDRLSKYKSDLHPSGNAFILRSFWHDLGARHGWEVVTVDQESIYSKSSGYDAHARLRYSVKIVKPVATSPTGNDREALSA